MDALKIFDRVQYAKLFGLLRQRDLCPTICRYLVMQYICQTCCVKWVDSVSTKFTVSNGVKQGGVLSPILFNVYMDCLLERLSSSGFGCYIGDVFSGAFSYADDLILLAPTRTSMKGLLKVCEMFSMEFDICFNSTKSKTVYFGGSRDINSEFSLRNKPIAVADAERHLGHFIGADSSQLQIQQTVNQLYSNVNLLLAQFSSIDVDVKYKLFKSFCMSVYGSPLWNFGDSDCERFYVAWRKCIRRLLNLPSRTHCNLLNIICNDCPVDVQLHRRFLKFLKSCCTSNNTCIKLCSELVLHGSGSNVCDSLTYICSQYKIERQKVAEFNENLLADLDVTEEWKQKGGLIRDLLAYNIDRHDDDVNSLIEELCIS